MEHRDIVEWCELIAQEINSQLMEFTVGAMELLPKSNCNTLKELEEYHDLVLASACNLSNRLYSIGDDISQVRESFRSARHQETVEGHETANAVGMESEGEESHACPRKTRGTKGVEYECSPRTRLVVRLDGKTVGGRKSKHVFANAIESIGAQVVYDVCKSHGIKINGMLPLSRDNGNLPYPASSTEIDGGWYVQGNICNRDKVKRLRQIGECLGLDLEVEMVAK